MAIDFEERARREEAGAVRLRSAAAEPSRDTYGIEERTRDAWARSPELRAEFRSYECYLAYSKANQKGLVRILGRSRGA